MKPPKKPIIKKDFKNSLFESFNKKKNIEKYLISNKFVNEDFYFKNVALFPNPNEESSLGLCK